MQATQHLVSVFETFDPAQNKEARRSLKTELLPNPFDVFKPRTEKDLHKAREVAALAVSGGYGPASPHTRAMLYVTLGKIEERLENIPEAARHFAKAANLYGAVMKEGDEVMAKRQWIRIGQAIGFFCLDSLREWDLMGFFSDHPLNIALDHLGVAYEFAEEVSSDQFEKLRTECTKRGIDASTCSGMIAAINDIYDTGE